MAWNSRASPDSCRLCTILILIDFSEHIWVTLNRHIETSHWAWYPHHRDGHTVNSQLRLYVVTHRSWFGFGLRHADLACAQTVPLMQLWRRVATFGPWTPILLRQTDQSLLICVWPSLNRWTRCCQRHAQACCPSLVGDRYCTSLCISHAVSVCLGS